MSVKKCTKWLESKMFFKVNAAIFEDLRRLGYQFLVTTDAIPDSKSGFANEAEGVDNIECIPYKDPPSLNSKNHRCYTIPSNRLNEMICNEADYIIRKKYWSRRA